jgi:tetratricopeptide (TPR) repeat protein
LQQATPRSIKEQHDSLKAAQALFDQALEIDANDADALAGEAAAYHAEYQFGWTSAETHLEAKIIDQANRPIALDPNNARAYFAKASYLMLTHRADDALRAANAGLAINPNFAPLYGTRSAAETSLGNFEAAKSDAQQAILLSPRDPLLGPRYINIGIAELGLGRYRRFPQGDRRWLRELHTVRRFGGHLRSRRQDRRDADRIDRRAPP